MTDHTNMTLAALRDQWVDRAEFADELAGTVAFDDSLLMNRGEGSGEDRGVERPLAAFLL